MPNQAKRRRPGGERRQGRRRHDARRRRAGARSLQERVVEPAKRAGEAMKASGEKIAEGGSTIGVQDDRPGRDRTRARRSPRCARRRSAKDLSEVMRIQGDYLREQGSRSMAQAREIGELIMQFGRDAVGAVTRYAPRKGGAKRLRSPGPVGAGVRSPLRRGRRTGRPASSDAVRVERMPVVLGLREPVGDRVEHRRVDAEAAVAAVDLDIVGRRGASARGSSARRRRRPRACRSRSRAPAAAPRLSRSWPRVWSSSILLPGQQFVGAPDVGRARACR